MGRTVSRGLGLRCHARSIRGSGLGVGRVGLGRSRVGLGRIGRSIGGVRQRLGVASGLLGAFGGGLRGVGGALRLTCGRGGTLRGSGSSIGGILRCLRRTIGRISRALRVFRCGSGILGSFAGIRGLSGIRDIRLRLGNFVRVLLDIGIAKMVPRGAIPDKRIDHAVGEQHEHGRRIIRSPEPVRVKVREQ